MDNSLQRLRGMLGFAMRAGKLTIGTEQVCAAMAKHGEQKPCLILLSQAASEATKKKVTVKSQFYRIGVRSIPLSPEEIGKLLGKTTKPVALAVHDARFSSEIEKCSDPAPIATKGSFRSPTETGEPDGNTTEND